jgi:xanthine dehydrogenase molybdenum-binding subunit
MTKFHYIGKPIKRLDGFDKVTGNSRFMQDMEVPGMLTSRILYSPHAHARIKRIITDKAERVPGVAAVVTHNDLPPGIDEVSGLEPGMVMPPTAAHPYLFRGWGLQPDAVVRCMGSPVAAVAAKTEEAATEALALIEVEYEPLPAVFTSEDALKPGAPQIYPDVPGNIIFDWKQEMGDVEKGFKEADLVFEETGETQPQSHLTPDTRGAIAWWEGERLIVCTSIHSAYPSLLPGLAAAFKLPESKIRIYGPPYMGGSYGGRAFNDASFTLLAILLARKAGKPVRLTLSRAEDMLALSRCSTKLHAKVGVKRDGTITAVEFHALLNPGPWFYPPWVNRYFTHLYKVIRCDNIRARATLTPTNIPFSGGPFRGFAYMEAFLVAQPILKKISSTLGIDYLQILQQSVWRTGEKVPNGPGKYSVLSSSGIDEAIEKGRKIIDWNGPREPDEYVGAGYCLPGSAQFPSNVVLRLNRDGSIQLETGVIEIGAGQYTTLTYMAAEAIGAPPEVINITRSYDTESHPWDGGQRSERTTYSTGLAIVEAAKEFRQKIFNVASRKLGARLDDLELEEGVLFVKSDPAKKMPLSGVALPIVATGAFVPDPDRPWASGPVATFVRVKVDKETGLVTPTKLVILNDVGRAINPPVVHTQNMGTLSAGVGFALTEEVIWDSDGRMLNTNPKFYTTPTILDVPEFQSEIIEPVDQIGPFGAKGCGEKVLTPSALAISAAVYDAVGEKVETPITPDKVLKALRKTE